jgi:hypothetical protein
MGNLSLDLQLRTHPRLRFFAGRLLLITVVWLATAGLIDMVKNDDYPSLALAIAAVVACALRATFMRLPAES